MKDKNKEPTRLTDKQERFVQELLKGASQREAYKIAYDTQRMTDSVIDVKACELFKHGKVSVRYEQLKSKIANRLEEDCIVTVEEVVKELKKIAFANMNDFLEYKTDLTVVGYEDGEPVNDYRTIINLKESSGVDGTMVNEVSMSKDGTLKFKLHDKMAALEKIGKHLGMFVERIDHSGKIEMPTIVISK